jgi:hypothetical protein
MKLKLLLGAALAALLSGPVFAATIDVTGKISANTTWTSDNTYLLDGYVFVTTGATLTIEPGTVVKGKVSGGTGAAALVIARGAKIEANGTAQNPIIFTSELDTLNGNLTHEDTGLWGGLVVLGNASINSRANGQPAGTPAQDQVEGFSVTGGDVDLITFGGTNDADNSGTIRYVSIRHGGAVIGTANEINGLTLGGVGSGTTVEYVEIFANKDDGVEFFGGTVNARYLVSAFNNDDAFDMDQGYRGNLQFLFAILGDITTDAGDKGFEWDGATSPLTATPKAKTAVANVTIIGASTTGKGSYAMNIRDAVEASVYNSVFLNFEKMVDFEDDVDDGPNPAPVLMNNIFYSHVTANNTAAALNARPAGAVDATTIIGHATNRFVTPDLVKVGYTADGSLDPRLKTGSAALTAAATLPDNGFFTATDYLGAFDTTTNWAFAWTKLGRDGYFDPASGTGEAEDASKLVAIATRARITGDSTVIAGFVISGTESQRVIVRAVGPQLATVGVTNPHADPAVAVYSGQTVIGENDDWTSDTNTIGQSVGLAPFAAASKDAAIVMTLQPGAYTAVVTGKGTDGEVLVEVYEVD